MPIRKILFVDDDPGVLKTAELLLRKAGYEFRAATKPAEAYSLLAVESVDAIFLDLNFSRAQMSGDEGLVCLREIRRHDPNAIVIVVTGHSGLTVAVQAMRGGANNFIMKPWNDDRLLEALEEALTQRAPVKIEAGAGEPDLAADSGMIVGECDALLRTKDLITRYAPLTASVFVMGENGTGKSLVAEALHRQSRRSTLKIIEAATFVPSDLNDLEDTSIVLENVENLDPAHSTFLTAWLQNAVRRNNRVVATTCREHPGSVMQRSLHYALSTLEMTLPRLCDRGNDIEMLAYHFLRIFALRQGLKVLTLTPEALAVLRANHWPDNLHAFRRVIERAAVSANGSTITAADLDLPNADSRSAPELGLKLELTEKHVIEEALGRHNFNISKAATELGVTRQTLYRRMVRHGL